MSSSDQPKTSLRHRNLIFALAELALAFLFVSLEYFWVFSGPHLSTDNMQNLFIGIAIASVLFALLGMGTLAFYVLKYIQRSLLLIVLFGATTFLIGVTLTLTAYTEYGLIQTKYQPEASEGQPDRTGNQIEEPDRDDDVPNNVLEQKTESSPEAG